MTSYRSRISIMAQKTMDVGGYIPVIGLPVIGYRAIDKRLDPDRHTARQARMQALYAVFAVALVFPPTQID